MLVSLLFRKRPAALSSSTGGHWLEELNSSGLLITMLRICIVPEAQRMSAANTPVHMHTAPGFWAAAASRRPTQPLINRLDYQQGGRVGFVVICPQLATPCHLDDFRHVKCGLNTGDFTCSTYNWIWCQLRVQNNVLFWPVKKTFRRPN